MTRKDYVAIAEAFSRMKPEAGAPPAALSQWLNDTIAVAHVLQRDNGRFDTDKFLRACRN